MIMISVLLVLVAVVTVAAVQGDPCSLGQWSREGNRWEEYLQAAEEARGVEGCTRVDGCSTCHQATIARDLAPWAGGIAREEVEEAARVARVTRYQVVNHTLYRSDDCMFPFRCVGIEHFLLEVVHRLPDLEMVVNVRDWPQADKRGPKLPIFSFSKVAAQHWDILYPAWAFWAGGPAIGLHPRGLGRWDLMSASITSTASGLPWEERKPLGFFRGSRTSGERDPLVLLSRRCPGIVDAQYTKNQGWKSDKDTLGKPPAEEVSLEDHCSYQYLFNYRGVAASFRLKHLFLCRSLVLHVGSDWEEFFYPSLVPWLHYVPVPAEADQQEILGLLHFLQEHEPLARRIAEAGSSLVAAHLTLEDVSCYWTALLTQYAALLTFPVTRDPAMHRVLPTKT